MKHGNAVFAAISLLLTGASSAEPSDYIYLPQVEVGEREVDFKFGSARQPATDGTRVSSQAASLGFGYGASETWFTEIYLKYTRDANVTRYDAIEWENKFQLTEAGQFPIDLGLVVEFEVPRDRGEGYEMKLGMLSQTDFGKLQLNGNVLLQRQYRNSASQQTQLGYQWQAKYRWRAEFEYGLQGFGEVGQWNQWDAHENQNHRLGPAVFGKIALSGRQAIKYNAAWLVGVSQAAPDHTLRLQTELEF
jgi:hypothetical protein